MKPSLNNDSRICFYGSLFGNLSDNHFAETQYVAAKTIGIVYSVGPECGVSKNSESSLSSVIANKQKYSACAMAIIKCMQLPGLADLSDTTCKLLLTEPRMTGVRLTL